MLEMPPLSGLRPQAEERSVYSDLTDSFPLTESQHLSLAEKSAAGLTAKSLEGCCLPESTEHRDVVRPENRQRLPLAVGGGDVSGPEHRRKVNPISCLIVRFVHQWRSEPARGSSLASEGRSVLHLFLRRSFQQDAQYHWNHSQYHHSSFLPCADRWSLITQEITLAHLHTNAHSLRISRGPSSVCPNFQRSKIFHSKITLSAFDTQNSPIDINPSLMFSTSLSQPGALGRTASGRNEHPRSFGPLQSAKISEFDRAITDDWTLRLEEALPLDLDSDQLDHR